MCVEKTPWEKAVEFHGHACPGLALGFRAAQLALQELGVDRDIDEELVAIVENDSCSIDAIQSLTGCTVGKGNMIMRNNGKQVFTIGKRSGGQAVRVALKFGVMQGKGDREERIKKLLHGPAEELFDIRKVDLELPGKAIIFNTVQCSRCGEGVMEPKARLRDGKPVCPDCFSEYTRGF
ncbi:formylmethanofuran dehydrogenase subunit E [Thermincola ferriacetica]|uniref:Formylmethanofuran dehydrogenase subunit E n=1 Tax=Thermincola ferriacetica TaxID=281456 RepID=A0A0L6W5P2_9FIRM|nr:FmdE family protein [Thermincola ferriacetica]KNZ70698.1 formylmethanofuran dehydrogenase subunit E [Thermincola ferriacetica]